MKYIDLRFEATTSQDRDALPPFLGATLRGALGYLLKQTVCQISHGNCGDCLLQPACAYPAIFEGLPPKDREWMKKYPNIPQPFVLIVDPPLENSSSGSRLRWGVRLFGPACRFWPYVVHVFQTAGERGIGKALVKFEIDSIRDGVTGNELLTESTETPSVPQEHLIDESCSEITGPCTLRWKFITPTRIRDRGGHVDGLSLFISGHRRFQVMNHFYGTASGETSSPRFETGDFQTESVDLNRYEFSRFSGRQKQTMNLRGLIGEIVIRGPWHELNTLITALPITHIGKSTSFGFGQVSWERV